MEKDFCKKCGECCKQIFVDFENKLLYFDGIQPLENDFADMLVPIGKKGNLAICYCKYLKNNSCTNHNRPNICSIYPSSPFAFIPACCGFYGETFMKNEAEKQKIRKIKEEIINYESLVNTATNKKEKQQYEKVIKALAIRVQKYSAYGSEDW